jgi:hypothetical protein
MTNTIPVSMSWTAPQFNDREFQKERASLTPERAYEMDCERRGVNAIPRETPQMRQRGLAQFLEALQTIEDVDKQDYMRALEISPEVVRKESDPLLFLRCEDYDAMAAAVRMTKYWKTRCKIFGERAFLPMTQSDGALTDDDVEVLRRGALQLLPPDAMGRQVVYLRRNVVGPSTRNRPALVSVENGH